MLPAQIIQRKRDGQALTEGEISFFIDGFTRGELPDYQMAALAMAICFVGMNFDETMWLTRAMIESGKVVEWKRGAFYADKHSTGGIGDKTSLIIAPLVAACGVRVPMISGRGLGPTGGTLDKLESIPGFRTDLSLEQFRRVTDEVGCCMIGATPEIAPADKKLYALRDVTATVSCLPLIVASIMSKKLAENIDGLVLDVKWGSGAFMRSRESSLALGRALVEVGKRYGKKVCALQTDMNQPLGQKIGNALEVQECIDIMSGYRRSAVAGATRTPSAHHRAQKGTPKTGDDLIEVTLALSAEMLCMAGVAKDVAEAREILQKKLASGDALKKFREMVLAQGGDPDAPLPVAREKKDIPAPVSGFVHAIKCDQVGYAVIALGGGRKLASDKIDFAVGFEHPSKIGDRVEKGEPLMIMHFNDATRAAEAERMVQHAYAIKPEPVTTRPSLITERIE
jgi:pyrimidine-nucleoside phosphorylase